jgi:hypothetical protein
MTRLTIYGLAAFGVLICLAGATLFRNWAIGFIAGYAAASIKFCAIAAAPKEPNHDRS